MEVFDKGLYAGKTINNFSNDGIHINIVQYDLGKEIIGRHYHLNSHLCFLLQGSDKEQTATKMYQRMAGQVFYYRSEQVHETLQINRSMKSMLIEFDRSFLQKHDLQEDHIDLALKENHHLQLSLLKILQEKQSIQDGTDFSSMQMLIINLCSFSKNLKLKLPDWLKKVEEILRDRWNETITLADLAQQVNIHPVTLCKYFAKTHQETLGEYMRKIKIEHSLSLIKNSNKNFSEIAHYCGFADQSHFIRCFKNATGYLPKDFRKL